MASRAQAADGFPARADAGESPGPEADWQGAGRRRGRRRFRWSALLWALVFPRSGQRVLPTASGVMLVALSFGIGSAAYNTANNILFITLALLLACLILSGLLSWLNLKGVTWRLQFPPALRAGEETSLVLELRNDKKFLPTHGLWFTLAMQPVGPPEPETGPGRAEPAARRSRSVREILAAAERGVVRTRLFLRTRLDPGGRTQLDWAVLPAARGRARLALESVGSLHPFGFLRKQIGSPLGRELLVWPAAVPYRRWGLLAARPQASGERLAAAGSSGDLRALRRYEPGDSHRLIHWKASARSRQLLVRQFAAESQETYAVWLVTSADRWPQPEQFERLVSFAAGLAEDLFRAGKLTDVALDEGAPRPVRRVRDFESWLDELALVQPRRAFRPGEAAALPELRRKNVITFAPDGAQGVAAHVDGRKTATA